jgi:hypothetical protein
MPKRWTDDETATLVRLWTERVGDYRNGKKAFYSAAAELIDGKDWKSVKNRCEFLERKCEAMRGKLRASGFGIESTDPRNIRANVVKELAWYYELDALLGPFKRTSTQIVENSPRAHSSPARASPRQQALAPSAEAATIGEQKGNTAQHIQWLVAPAPAPTRAVIPMRFPTPSSMPKAITPHAKSKSSPETRPPTTIPTPMELPTAGPTQQAGKVDEANAALSNGNITHGGHSKKRKQSPEPTLVEALREFGAQWQTVERERLALMQRQFEFEMVARREEQDLRREHAEQRRQEFELKFQTLRAQYELDKAALETKLRKTH